MIRFASILAVVCILLAAPYIYFQIRINEAFLASSEAAGAWNLVRAVKFITFGMAGPAVIVGVSVWFKRRRILASVIASGLYLLILLTLTNFYDYFGIVPHWNQLGSVDQLGAVKDHISAQLLGIEDFLMIASIVLGTFVTVLFLKIPTGKSWLRFAPVAIGLPAVLLLGIQFLRHPPLKTLNAFGYTMGCSHYGVGPTYTLMLRDFLPRKNREVAFPKSEKSSYPSEKFGIASGSNVLCLQIESLDSSLIGRRIGGEPVMPFLEKLARDGVYFPECAAMHAGGGSSDAELAALLSLVPLTSGSGFTSADWSRVTPLSDPLNEAGYTCVAMHANRGSFYDRTRRYNDMNFAEFRDQEAFSDEAAGWYSRDDAFFEQGLAHLDTLSKPFFGYLISMQSHGPFKNFRSETRERFGSALEEFGELEANYLCTFREVDDALTSLFSDLKARGLLESTVIVIYGDHESGVLKSSHNAGERVPLIVCHPELASAKGTHLISQIDIAPTITDLLGLKSGSNWLGDSIFSRETKPAVVLPTGLTISESGTTASFDETGFRTVDYSRALLGN